MNASLSDIIENTKLGREYALLGNYESSLVHYQGVLQQIHKLIATINDPIRGQQWQEIQRIIAAECENVRDVQYILSDFKGDNKHTNRIWGHRFNNMSKSNGLSLSMVSISSIEQDPIHDFCIDDQNYDLWPSRENKG